MFDPLEYFPHLEAGDEVPPFVAENLKGGTEAIDYPADGQKTFLFVLSPNCGSCLKMVPKWNRIVREIGDRARIFGLVVGSYQSEQKLLEQKELEFPALRFPNEELLRRYKLNKVPQTILVAPGGRVEKNVQGELTDAQVEDLLDRVSAHSTETSA